MLPKAGTFLYANAEASILILTWCGVLSCAGEHKTLYSPENQAALHNRTFLFVAGISGIVGFAISFFSLWFLSQASLRCVADLLLSVLACGLGGHACTGGHASPSSPVLTLTVCLYMLFLPHFCLIRPHRPRPQSTH